MRDDCRFLQPTAFYNERDPYAAEWLRNLIAAGHIAPGVVSEEDIRDLRPADLAGYTQCHFFAGIGVWSHALRNAGWADDRSVWTGSCPCQPFSAAGRRAGVADERHLWPHWHWLIDQCRPAIVLGEQVASKDGLGWLDLVSADLERSGYAVGASDLCAAGFGGAHIRQRLYFVGMADAERQQRLGRRAGGEGDAPRTVERAERLCDAGGLGNPELPTQPRQRSLGGTGLCQQEAGGLAGTGLADGLDRPGEGAGLLRNDRTSDDARPHAPMLGRNPADWLFCRDGRWRPACPSPQPLADASADSLGRVRPEIIAAIKEEIDALAVESQINGAALVRDLLEALGAQAQCCWQAGRVPGLHEAPFLLAFLRQLSEQGWGFTEGDALSRPEAAPVELRMLWHEQSAASASHQRGLDGQQPEQSSDPLHLLSSLLARHAHSAWGEAYAAYAETVHPLTRNAPARVGRLRAYGNALDAETAAGFVGAVMEAIAAPLVAPEPVGQLEMFGGVA